MVSAALLNNNFMPLIGKDDPKTASQISVTVTEAMLRNEETRKAISSKFSNNPNLECIIDVSGKDVLEIETEILPSTIRRLAFVNCGSCTAISHHFLNHCDFLVSVSFHGLGNVTEIGAFFLRDCTSLCSANLSTFEKVSVIEEGFFFGCTSLRCIEGMTSLQSVSQIGARFLCDCESLESVNLSAFRHVTTINYGFLAGCSSLKTVEGMSGLKNATSIGSNFLYCCSALHDVDLSAFGKVTCIGGGFLCGCESLEMVDISGLSNIMSIGDQSYYRRRFGCNFLTDCGDVLGLSNFPKEHPVHKALRERDWF
eukprot:TRINITY_DN61_c0_g1_i2.p1 TRINITY_DN61_c0_g1~~TRINITY_DN61_c0_g1_i2.p1  ORF type:complete len:335 (+),score=41.94 TRINITY_DN61_c0_g1_i2:71-1006(+)